ncbi:MAG: hypothetical protein EU981_03525 [Candidatus Liberibacter ctenarytainae]|uniref:Uncharacterized protein n=1 Tax=Candidatus Liberibacter ctenarytainae TaxID=2020335 RepID=A0A937DM14_9HYPH|nr:hypothetical protein [Candidatus Liberibacter ctenarytainae]
MKKIGLMLRLNVIDGSLQEARNEGVSLSGRSRGRDVVKEDLNPVEQFNSYSNNCNEHRTNGGYFP